MQIERAAHDAAGVLGRTADAFCALECVNCRGICLAVYYMLSQEERNALAEMNGTTSPFMPEPQKTKRRLS